MEGITEDLADNLKKVFNKLTPEVLHTYHVPRRPERRRIPLAMYLLDIIHNRLIEEYMMRFGESRVYIKILNLSDKTS
jgi:hypothetical protein